MQGSMTFRSRRCDDCFGTGMKRSIEQDTGMGIVMGAAVGCGYFPMTKTVTKVCARCNGRGLVEDVRR